VYTGKIRWISVSDECNLLLGFCSANSLIHSGNSWLNSSVICDMVGGYFKVFRGDKEEGVVVFAHDLDIGFITCTYRIDRAFMLEIKAMTVESGCRGVIENGLIRDIDVKDRPQDKGSFSGSDSERDVESKNKAKDIWGVMDFRKINFRFMRLRM